MDLCSVPGLHLAHLPLEFDLGPQSGVRTSVDLSGPGHGLRTSLDLDLSPVSGRQGIDLIGAGPGLGVASGPSPSRTSRAVGPDSSPEPPGSEADALH